MTVNDSSSSVASPAENRSLDLLENGLLPPLPAAFLAGRDLDLLGPLRFVSPREPDPLSSASPAVDRSALAQALAVANASYGHPGAERLAGRLADPETRVIVTGQQPGLFGGPLYTLTKAVAAAQWVRRIQASGLAAVAVFWVATEDHDYREVSRLSFPAAGGLETLDLGADPSPLLPVGMRTFGPQVVTVLDSLRAGVPGDRFAEWVDKVAGWYRPDARFGEAFCKMMAALLGEECPLLLDAMLPAVKQAERPWLERVTASRDEIEERYSASNRLIEQRGYPLQVTPQPGSSPLFFLHGESRRRIEWRANGRVGLRGEDEFDEGMDWLERVLSENPAAVSPGVLARPAIQDAILGTSIQVMGPGEVSYLPQVAPLYECLEIEAPQVALRPQAMVLSRHQIDKLDKLPIELAELLSPRLDLDRALAQGQGSEMVAPVGARMEKLLDELKTRAVGLDKSLERPWEKTAGQIHKALEVFTAKVNQAATRRDELGRQRAEDLRVACRPGGTLQERALTTAYFPGKYGGRFVEALFEQLGTDGGKLQVVTP
ncbi:MAG: bacillithiol biosynthesis cysteine-adding enzyme BshC [Acidobacteriota bacterium]|nr:bacillithiol biosynthesis cysteine-adding enzyme BshC [Acidobacteriota bacterium]